jgi:hypothetical protein
MKKLLLAASTLAMFATPALADGNNRNTDTETFTIRANNPAKCNLEASDYTLRLPGNSLSDNDGFARTTVSQAVADELTAANVSAWCTGSSNTLQMYRTAFTLNGTDGNQATDGFNQALIYDVEIAIAGATRSDGTDPIEGTSDGQGNGPGVGVGAGLTVGRFGPTGDGSPATFTAESDSNATSSGTGAGDRATFPEDGARLVAGQYTSSLTIELTPGV